MLLMNGLDKRVAFFVYEYAVGNSASIISAAQLLVKHGYQVDVFCNAAQLLEGCINIEGVRFVVLPTTWRPRGWGKPDPDANNRGRSAILARRVWRRLVYETLPVRWLASVVSFSWQAFKATRGVAYVCLIGIEPEGLIASSVLARLDGRPLVYYSLELHLKAGLTDRRRRLRKRLERSCHRFAAFTIVQDDQRAKVLSEENGVSVSTMVKVPVGVTGSPPEGKSNYLRQKFNIPVDKVIILHAGSIAPWGMCLELAHAAKSWPDNWVLIIHGPARPGYHEAVAAALQDCGGILSLGLVSWQEFDELVGSADIGVALYRDLGSNFYHIGSASGKLAQYLKCRLPVVTVDFEGLRSIIAHYRCGVCVADEWGVQPAIEQILADYQRCSANATTCYLERYDLSRYFDRVIERVGQFR